MHMVVFSSYQDILEKKPLKVILIFSIEFYFYFLCLTNSHLKRNPDPLFRQCSFAARASFIAFLSYPSAKVGKEPLAPLWQLACVPTSCSSLAIALPFSLFWKYTDFFSISIPNGFFGVVVGHGGSENINYVLLNCLWFSSTSFYNILLYHSSLLFRGIVRWADERLSWLSHCLASLRASRGGASPSASGPRCHEILKEQDPGLYKPPPYLLAAEDFTKFQPGYTLLRAGKELFTLVGNWLVASMFVAVPGMCPLELRM